MTRDEVLLRLCACFGVNPPIADFNIVGVNAVLDAVIAAEREKVAQWMIGRGYATGHGDTTEDLLTELGRQFVENWTSSVMKVAANEREACLKAVERAKVHQFILYPKGASIDANKVGDIYAHQHKECVEAIRARGEK